MYFPTSNPQKPFKKTEDSRIPHFLFCLKTRIFSPEKICEKIRPFRNEATRNRIALAYWKANRSSVEPLGWYKTRRISTKHNKNWLNLTNCIIWLWHDSLAWDILAVMGILSFKGLRNHPWLTFLWMLNFAHELGIERLFFKEELIYKHVHGHGSCYTHLKIHMEPKSHQIKREIIVKTHHFLWSILIFQGIPCLFKHVVAKMLREQRESNEKAWRSIWHGFFSDTERFGNDGVFPPWRFFFPSHLAATEPFSFLGSKKSIFKKRSKELSLEMSFFFKRDITRTWPTWLKVYVNLICSRG